MHNTAWRVVVATIVLVALTGANDVEGGALTDWVTWVRESAVGKFIAAFILSSITWMVNWIRATTIPDRGGTVQVTALSFVSGIILSIASGSPLDPTLVETSLAVALTAIGGYTAVKRIGWPVVKTATPTHPVDVVTGTIDIPPADAAVASTDDVPTDPQRKRPGAGA